MQDNTRDAFQVQEEHKGGECDGLERGRYQEGPIGGYGCGHNLGYGGVGGRPLTCFNYGEIGHVSRFCTKRHVIFSYCYSLEHVTEDYLDLLKNWEDKETNCNMVHAE